MKIAIYNMEPNYTNIALEKVKLYHEMRENTVEEYDPLAPINYLNHDKIYCSSIFTFTPKEHLQIDSRWEVGGTGFDIYKTLPSEIDCMKPRINVGFTSRGCIRNCKFCVVRKKEGCIKPVGDIYDIWDGESRQLMLLDNNILAIPSHFKMIASQLKKEKIKISFKQGLDIRLMTPEIASILKNISHEEYYFAFDNIKEEAAVRSGIKMLKEAGINRSCFYVLIGYDSTFEQDLYRLKLLKSLGQRAYAMRYKKVIEEMGDGLITETNRRVYVAICNWANNRAWFSKKKFTEYLNVDRVDNRNYKRIVEEYCNAHNIQLYALDNA